MHRLTVTLYSITVVQKRGNYMKFRMAAGFSRKAASASLHNRYILVKLKKTR